VAAGARPPLDPSDVGGCGCAVPGQGAGDDTALGALALSLLGAASRLQRRRRAR
jgi:MYXO-CTERM domain-containing protein